MWVTLCAAGLNTGWFLTNGDHHDLSPITHLLSCSREIRKEIILYHCIKTISSFGPFSVSNQHKSWQQYFCESFQKHATYQLAFSQIDWRKAKKEKSLYETSTGNQTAFQGNWTKFGLTFKRTTQTEVIIFIYQPNLLVEGQWCCINLG